MNTPELSALGKAVAYPEEYDPGQLFPIARRLNREAIGIGDVLPFHGCDVWNAYELSWLDGRGKPVVALAEFRVPAASPNIIESKSFKLYLNSFMQTRMTDADAVRERLQRDLSAAAGAPVGVALTTHRDFANVAVRELDGVCIDDEDVAIDGYGPPQASTLSADPEVTANEALVSHLLKSNCPVTGQPDWASVQIRYEGPRIDRAGLLRYLVSFRRHSDFHEHCVERIFIDLMQRCAPAKLEVYARYTRRGGLDINPFRSSHPAEPGNPRSARQ